MTENESPPVGKEEADEAMSVFDAGAMGCTDGLAKEFRLRMTAIEVGEVLTVVVRDPSGKEDLPPLARMLGHKVLSIEESENGALSITVERGR